MKITASVDYSNFELDMDAIESAIEEALEESANAIEKGAKNNTPVDTGRLRNSIEAETNGMEANIGTDVYYAGYVHDGTYRMAARPFLFSAADAEIGNLVSNIADAIERLL